MTSAYLFNIYVDDILSYIIILSPGCRVGINKINIQAYADDIVLLSQSYKSLQFLIDKISELLTISGLILNSDKTVILIFRKTKDILNENINFTCNENTLKIVDSFKYLGFVCNFSFNKSFGFLFRKFCSVDVDVFYSLFRSYCTSFYGCELWTNRKRTSKNFKQMSVGFHIALKKFLGPPKFYSNHIECEILCCFTFEHFRNFKCLKFLFWLNKCQSICFSRFKFYFLNLSLYVTNFKDFLNKTYNVFNIIENDFAALRERIKYVQVREPSSMFQGL